MGQINSMNVYPKAYVYIYSYNIVVKATLAWIWDIWKCNFLGTAIMMMAPAYKGRAKLVTIKTFPINAEWQAACLHIMKAAIPFICVYWVGGVCAAKSWKTNQNYFIRTISLCRSRIDEIVGATVWPRYWYNARIWDCIGVTISPDFVYNIIGH